MPPKYKPGGSKFPPKKTSVSNTVPSTVAASSSSPSSSPNLLDPEIEDQLEIELCWCIQQLEASLNSGKLNERQTLDTNKTLNVLKSNTAPLIKKRQFMRTTFGDYRTKMSIDQKKLGKTSAQVKFSDNNVNSNKKSIFIKKAAVIANKDDVKSSNENNFRIVTSSENNFKFDFSEPEEKS